MRYIIALFLTLVVFISPVYAKNNIDISYENGIYHIVLSGKKIKKRIKFVASENLITNREAHKNSRSILTINTGFFDPESGKTMSYIVTDRNTAVDPMFTDSLLYDPVLRRNREKILNRTEFRIVECNNKYHYEIAPHKSDVDFGCTIITSAQGGPMILPKLQLEEEFFVVKDKEGNVIRESASVLHKTSRTIMAIKDDEAHILIITDQNPMDIFEVQALCRKLNFDRAMAFDGGSSTSMNYKNKIEVVSTIGDGVGRMLKSFMIIPKK